jgi:hypothetical protein
MTDVLVEPIRLGHSSAVYLVNSFIFSMVMMDHVVVIYSLHSLLIDLFSKLKILSFDSSIRVAILGMT